MKKRITKPYHIWRKKMERQNNKSQLQQNIEKHTFHIENHIQKIFYLNFCTTPPKQTTTYIKLVEIKQALHLFVTTVTN